MMNRMGPRIRKLAHNSRFKNINKECVSPLIIPFLISVDMKFSGLADSINKRQLIANALFPVSGGDGITTLYIYEAMIVRALGAKAPTKMNKHSFTHT